MTPRQADAITAAFCWSFVFSLMLWWLVPPNNTVDLTPIRDLATLFGLPVAMIGALMFSVWAIWREPKTDGGDKK